MMSNPPSSALSCTFSREETREKAEAVAFSRASSREKVAEGRMREGAHALSENNQS
jgi:hypothetical protein